MDNERAVAFALFVEHKEIITLLDRFLKGSYDVSLEVRTGIMNNGGATLFLPDTVPKYFACTIKYVYPKKDGDHWQSVGVGRSPLIAVKDAVERANEILEGRGELP